MNKLTLDDPINFVYTFLLILLSLSSSVYASEWADTKPWQRHTIDNSSQGADGIRMKDIDNDGLLDLVTGWEEGGEIRVYKNPGKEAVKQPWPRKTIGKVISPEDAVFADINMDGQYEVISSCEGSERRVFIHQADSNKPFHSETRWSVQPINTLDGSLWMFCLPLNIDNQDGPELVLGAKGQNAQLGWLSVNHDEQSITSGSWHVLQPLGWVMSIDIADMDGDGDDDILVSDRKGDTRACYWLERPESDFNNPDAWKYHQINDTSHEFMFMDHADFDQDGDTDVAVATPIDGIKLYTSQNGKGTQWQTQTIMLPENTGTGKAVKFTDVDLDGKNDLIFTCEHATDKHGVAWLKQSGSKSNPEWLAHPISGLEGTKFDLIQLLDVDHDGDMDVLTCEEREQLGVIWYENPTI